MFRFSTYWHSQLKCLIFLWTFAFTYTGICVFFEWNFIHALIYLNIDCHLGLLAYQEIMMAALFIQVYTNLSGLN